MKNDLERLDLMTAVIRFVFAAVLVGLPCSFWVSWRFTVACMAVAGFIGVVAGDRLHAALGMTLIRSRR